MGTLKFPDVLTWTQSFCMFIAKAAGSEVPYHNVMAAIGKRYMMRCREGSALSAAKLGHEQPDRWNHKSWEGLTEIEQTDIRGAVFLALCAIEDAGLSIKTPCELDCCDDKRARFRQSFGDVQPSTRPAPQGKKRGKHSALRIVK